MDGSFGGDIWSTGAFASFESPLKDLLDSGEYTVEELLQEDELLQELRGMHPLLIDYFSKEAVMTKLVQLLITANSSDNGRKNANATNGVRNLPKEPSNRSLEKPTDRLFSDDDIVLLRYPYVACEIICCEITAILDVLVDGALPKSLCPTLKEIDENTVDEETRSDEDKHNDDESPADTECNDAPIILDLLFSVLTKTKPGELNDYPAGYLDKILGVLCRRRPETMMLYLEKNRDIFLPAMMSHLYSYSIMQIVQRLLLPHNSSFTEKGEDGDATKDNDEEAGGAIISPCNTLWENGSDNWDNPTDDADPTPFQSRWLEAPQVVDLLLEKLLLPSEESQNASEILITIIQNSPLSSPILRQLTSDPCGEKIMIAAVQLPEELSPYESTSVMSVLESLVLQLAGFGSIRPDDDDDAENQATVDTIVSHLDRFLLKLQSLLCHKSTHTWKSCPQFSPTTPQLMLGSCRLRMIRLLESLVLLGNAQVDECLCRSSCLEICLKLFWEFEWNSMLHQSVANLLVHIFESDGAPRVGLQEYFLSNDLLLPRLMKAFDEEDEAQPGQDSLHDTVMKLKQQASEEDKGDKNESTFTDDVDVEDDGDADILPVSDDDVDAALEANVIVVGPAEEEDTDDMSSEEKDEFAVLQQVLTSPDAATASHVPALRKGYMGHIIIICQALVHACAGASSEEEGEAEVMGITDRLDKLTSHDTDSSSSEEDPAQESESNAVTKEEENPSNKTDGTQEESPSKKIELPFVAELIRNHALYSQWYEFVSTTLAAETGIQSTPLGGFQQNANNFMSDSAAALQQYSQDFRFDDAESDDSDSDDEGIIDMDDADIDIAASMMDAIQHATDYKNTERTNGHENIKSKNNNNNNYMFDDPLGNPSRFDAQFDDEVDDDSDKSDSDDDIIDDMNKNNSNDDPVDAPNAPEDEEQQQAPVMDLFAGNFANFDETNFANFDDAFAAPLGNEERNTSKINNTDTADVFTSNADSSLFAPTKLLLDDDDKEGENSETTSTNKSDNNNTNAAAIETPA
mmetsp:Transcript_18334/g.27163  ORF Transcript_18334/g.27163 Transcript_18334/m.27163 type:complete len:1031 (+) Transcript_18334:230-3322(+)